MRTTFGLLLLSYLAFGCTSRADDAHVTVREGSHTRGVDCRLSLDKTFDVENAQMTPICEDQGGSGSGLGGAGGGEGDPGDDPGWKAQGYAACVDGCSSAGNDCLADPQMPAGCGYVQEKTPESVPGGVGVKSWRVPLPAVPPEQPGSPGCNARWITQCWIDASDCVRGCDSQW